MGDEVGEVPLLEADAGGFGMTALVAHIELDRRGVADRDGDQLGLPAGGFQLACGLAHLADDLGGQLAAAQGVGVVLGHHSHPRLGAWPSGFDFPRQGGRVARTALRPGRPGIGGERWLVAETSEN